MTLSKSQLQNFASFLCKDTIKAFVEANQAEYQAFVAEEVKRKEDNENMRVAQRPKRRNSKIGKPSTE